MIPHGFVILVGSSFIRGLQVENVTIMRTWKSEETLSISSYAALDFVGISMWQVLPRERKSVERVIRCQKGPFSRIFLPIILGNMKGGIFIRACVLLLNFRTLVICLNQLRTACWNSNDKPAPWVLYFREKTENCSYL